MRGFTRAMVLSLGLLAAGACSDSKPSPTVGKDISWQLCRAGATGTCEASKTAHKQADDATQDFHVSCGSNSGLFSFTIKDPGLSAVDAIKQMSVARPASTIQVTNYNPASGDCTVQVVEADEPDSDPIPYSGQCNADCTLTSSTPSQGWDFEGTLSCKSLHPNGNTADPSLFLLDASPALSAQPITVQLGNCD